MYGGRTSLFIGFVSALITTLLATILGLLAGYYRGWADARDLAGAGRDLGLPGGAARRSRSALALAVGGLKIGPLDLSGSSIWIPILIIGFVYTPYMARPIRGEVLALREKEFVEAAVAQGAGPLRVMFGELLPNLASTIIVFFTLSIANNMLLEAALSFLGAGVQPPNSSWGTMISRRLRADLPPRRCWPSSPASMILLTVLSLNVFGDGLRDALDPRSKLRLEAHAGHRRARGDGGLMARFIVRRLVGMVAGPLRRLGARLPDLQRDPELRPGAAHGGQERDARRWSTASKRNGASTTRCRSST